MSGPTWQMHILTFVCFSSWCKEVHQTLFDKQDIKEELQALNGFRIIQTPQVNLTPKFPFEIMMAGMLINDWMRLKRNQIRCFRIFEQSGVSEIPCGLWKDSLWRICLQWWGRMKEARKSSALWLTRETGFGRKWKSRSKAKVWDNEPEWVGHPLDIYTDLAPCLVSS